MVKSNKILIVLAVVLFVFFLTGLARLFILRFDAGDFYPVYSSLRSDPLGTKAFFKSIENLKNISARRNYLSLEQSHLEDDTTLFYLGARPYDLVFKANDVQRRLDRFVAAGGRLIFSFLPVNEGSAKKSYRRFSEEIPETEANAPPQSTQAKEKSANDTKKALSGSLAALWGINIEFARTLAGQKFATRQEPHETGLPHAISWHTVLYFNDPQGLWKVIYNRDDRPVIIERALGRGTVVFSADTYLFSNEALHADREPELLAWFIGNKSKVIFDESHFGIRENPGISSLLRKYRLHGFIFGVLLMAGLFVWKNSTYFVPPPADKNHPAENRFTAERDSTEAMIGLLLRNIPKQEILSVCVREWQRFSVSESKLPAKKKGMLTNVNAEKLKMMQQADVVRGYQAICRTVAEGKKLWKETRKS
ncbi:DUF4350 domain-containing protein [Thermodesulfobacteriota bacterium]